MKDKTKAQIINWVKKILKYEEPLFRATKYRPKLFNIVKAQAVIQISRTMLEKTDAQIAEIVGALDVQAAKMLVGELLKSKCLTREIKGLAKKGDPDKRDLKYSIYLAVPKV